MNTKYESRKGFTLIELLVVVIIIAILAAIAVPQYKHAVLKSRFSTVMPMAKSIADAQEVYYQGQQMYALSTDELDVTPVTAENTSVALSTQAEEDKYAYVAAQRSDVPGARYIIYQKYSPMFANTIQCEADENNEDAVWLCEKGLNGTEISGSVNTAQGNYRTFLLSGTAGTTDKLPTSLAKLAAGLCAGKENCTTTLGEDTVTSSECSGDVNSSTQTCITRTYDDTGTQIDYEGTTERCRPFSNNAYPNATKCEKETYNENNQQTGSSEEICNLNVATWKNGVCTWTSGGGDWYRYDETKGNNRRYYSYTCNNADCSSERRQYTELEGGVSTFSGRVYYSTYPSKGKVVYAFSDYTYWNLPAQNLKTTVSQNPPTSYLSPTGNVIFTTTNTQTNEVTNTVTCAYSDADWEHGTCKEGTAI